MRQAGDLLAQYGAVAADVSGADLEEIVEVGRQHVAFLDFGNAAHRAVEVPQRRLACVGEADFDESDMVQPEARRIDNGAKAPDHPAVDQLAHPRLAGRFRHARALGEIGDGDPAVFAQNGDDLAVHLVQIDWYPAHIHEKRPKMAEN